MLSVVRKAALRFLKEDDGATAIEYGLLVAGISLIIVAAVFALGDTLAGFFTMLAGLFG
jgi:pilus assembly protein Flp/PilA